MHHDPPERAHLHPDLTEGTGPARAAAALLWAACRPVPDNAAVSAAIQAGADLEMAALSAISQGVGPLLWRAVERHATDASGDASAPWAASLRQEALRRRAQAVLVVGPSLPAAIDPLRDARLEPLVIKGGALFERYPGPGLRPMDDLDVLLPDRQHARAYAALTEAGWELRPTPGIGPHEVRFVHPGLPDFPVDLHRELESRGGRATGLTAEQLWQRRQPATFAGVPAFGLDLEDELVLLATHAGKPFHCFSRLMWTVDIAVAVAHAAANGRPVDWARLARLTHETRCRTVMAVALHQAVRLGVDVPAELTEPAARGVRRRALEPLFSETWPVAPRDSGVRNRTRFALVDDRSRRLSILLADVFRDGPRRAPGKAGTQARRAWHRWWQLRSSGTDDRPAERPPGSRTAMGSGGAAPEN